MFVRWVRLDFFDFVVLFIFTGDHERSFVWAFTGQNQLENLIIKFYTIYRSFFDIFLSISSSSSMTSSVPKLILLWSPFWPKIPKPGVPVWPKRPDWSKFWIGLAPPFFAKFPRRPERPFAWDVWESFEWFNSTL